MGVDVHIMLIAGTCRPKLDHVGQQNIQFAKFREGSYVILPQMHFGTHCLIPNCLRQISGGKFGP